MKRAEEDRRSLWEKIVKNDEILKAADPPVPEGYRKKFEEAEAINKQYIERIGMWKVLEDNESAILEDHTNKKKEEIHAAKITVEAHDPRGAGSMPFLGGKIRQIKKLPRF